MFASLLQPVLPVDPIIRANLKAMFAHLRRYAYLRLPDLEHKKAPGDKGVGKVNFVRHFYRTKKDTKRYSGAVLRELREQRGCSKRKVAAPKVDLMFTKLSVPWTGRQKVVGYKLGTNEDGKYVFDEFRVFRDSPQRLRRDMRFERGLRDEQWTLMFKALAQRIRAQTESMPSLILP